MSEDNRLFVPPAEREQSAYQRYAKPLSQRVRESGQGQGLPVSPSLISWGDMFDVAIKATVCFGLVWAVIGGVIAVLWLIL